MENKNYNKVNKAVNKNTKPKEQNAIESESVYLPVARAIKVKDEIKKYRPTTIVNIRKEPDLSSSIIRMVNVGDILESQYEKDGWLKFNDGWSLKQFYVEV